MSAETPVPINIYAVQKKGTNDITLAMTTLTIGAWNSQNPELQIFGQRAIDVLGGLSNDDQTTFLQMIKIPGVARAFEAITEAYSAVASSALRSEIESSDIRLRGQLAMDMMLKMFGRDTIEILVQQYSRAYPVTGERSGIELERAARAEAPPVAPAPTTEGPRVLRPGFAETVSEEELARSVPGEAFGAEKEIDPSLIEKLRAIPES